MERVTELLLPLSKIAIPGDHPDAIYGVWKIVRAMPLGRKMLGGLLPLSKIAIPGDDAIYGVWKIVRAIPLGRKNVEVMMELLAPFENSNSRGRRYLWSAEER